MLADNPIDPILSANASTRGGARTCGATTTFG
jgi:hypothetical protein